MRVNKFHLQTAIGSLIFVILLGGFLFLAAVFASHPAFSQTSNGATKESRCISTLQHQSNVAKRIKGKNITVRMRVLRNGAARRFMTAFNAVPPESNVQADTVGIIVVAGVNSVWITLATNKCIQGEFQLPVKVFLAIMDKSGNRQGDA